MNTIFNGLSHFVTKIFIVLVKNWFVCLSVTCVVGKII